MELKEKTFAGFLEWVLELRKKLNIPHKLSDIIKIKDLDTLSLMALHDPSTSGNPKELKLEDIKLMYENSLKGELF